VEVKGGGRRFEEGEGAGMISILTTEGTTEHR